MKKFLLQLTIGLLGLAGLAGVTSAASLDVTGWALSFMPIGSDQNNQNYNPNRPDHNVGQGAGWISMTSQNNPGLSFSYGVKVEDTTGSFSGEAWNQNLGYVNFSGASVNSSCLANKTGTAPMNGSIRFLGASLPQSGGWDGVVDLQGGWGGVTVDCATGQLSGYGWGDVVVGWVDFKWVTIQIVPDEPEPGDVYCINPNTNDIIYFDPEDYPSGEGPEECELDDTSGGGGGTGTGPVPIYKEN